jgi:pimeloyl-ACP methyl ester carboxylesterase
MLRDRGATLTGLGLGVGLMYFLDLERGRRRRAPLNRLARAVNTGADAAATTGRELACRAAGAAASMRGALRGRAGSMARQRVRLSGGTELSFITAGDASNPAVLLLHGFPGSARAFRDVMPELSRDAYAIAPDLPGFGESDVLPTPSFPAFGQAIAELLAHLAIGPRYIYLHDFGAPVGFHIAMQAPQQVLGVIVQNANAHRTGHGPQWAQVKAYWSQPNPENEAAATAHLTVEGTRNGYLAGMPSDVAARVPAESWEDDWRVMQLPGRMDTQRALIADYGHYVSRFDAIAEYLARWQPPALMVWGRHDGFFDLAEVLSWMQTLPRMEAHVLDAGHKLLETHAAAAASLMVDFIRRTEQARGAARK